jgi:hypothetical protein
MAGLGKDVGGWPAEHGGSAKRHPPLQCKELPLPLRLPGGGGLSQHHALLHILHTLPLAPRPRGLHPVHKRVLAAAAQGWRRQQADGGKKVRYAARLAAQRGAPCGQRHRPGGRVGATLDRRHHPRLSPQASRDAGARCRMQGKRCRLAALPPAAFWALTHRALWPSQPSPGVLCGWQALSEGLQGSVALVILKRWQGRHPSKRGNLHAC